MSLKQLSFQHSVLFVDSLDNSQNFIRSGLLAYPVQFEFCEAKLGLALSKVKQKVHDVIIVSTQFQEGLVLDFAREIHQHFAHIPSIYLAESNALPLHEELIKLGALEILQRPKESTGLIHCLDRVIHTTKERQFRTEFALNPSRTD